jgi:arsenite methyltransferase
VTALLHLLGDPFHPRYGPSVLSRLLAAQLRRPSGLLGRGLAHLLNRANRQMNRRAAAHLDVRTGQRLLEVGFGGGVGIEAMLDVCPDVHVTGVDFSRDMVAQQRRRLAGLVGADRLRLEEADVATLPFSSQSFDRVLSCNTIYFWPDPVLALREILRVLAPGGRLVLACTTKERLEQFPPARHGFARLDGDEVRSLLRNAGYEGIEIARPQGEPWYFAIAHRPVAAA